MRSRKIHKPAKRGNIPLRVIKKAVKEVSQMRGEVIAEQDIGYLERILFEKGKLQIMDADFYKSIPHDHLRIFCVKNGIYQLPTTELVKWLEDKIDGRLAIEIASGNGSLAEALNITATDSFIQEDPAVKMAYESMKQQIVPYGRNVKKMEAKIAIKKYTPKVVIACWATQKYQPGDTQAFMWGVNEEYVIKRAETYIHIGNRDSHDQKKILSKTHSVYQFPWLYSRGENPKNNIIYVWEKQ